MTDYWTFTTQRGSVDWHLDQAAIHQMSADVRERRRHYWSAETHRRLARKHREKAAALELRHPGEDAQAREGKARS
jgi:hypothetical protein